MQCRIYYVKDDESTILYSYVVIIKSKQKNVLAAVYITTDPEIHALLLLCVGK